MTTLLFTDLVAVITGSGGGLGRIYALDLAKRGAKVLINDLGVSKIGEGVHNGPADQVVEEIRSFGGVAYPNYDSVENGDKIIDCALKKFGKIDILINNAGILRDRSFVNMTDNDWNLVLNVHLNGAYKITKAAWSAMRKNKFGRIIFTSSASGIYGNFGQANYSAAKLGLLGLCNTLALEGKSHNITCNTIAPLAKSRMTEDIFPPDLLDQFLPDYVAPLVLYLCHPNSTETGSVFEVCAGWYSKLRWEGNKGVYLSKNMSSVPTPEDVRDSWNEICDFSETRPAQSVAETMKTVSEAMKSSIESQKILNSSTPPTLESFIGKTKTDNIEKITSDKAILYALSVCMGVSRIENLKFLYEGHINFSVLPTYPISLCLKFFESLINEMISIPGVQIDYSTIVHGEQYLEIFAPLEIGEKYTGHGEIVDVINRGRGASLIYNVNLLNKQNELVSKMQYDFYIKGAGGFNGRNKSKKTFLIKPHPNRNPDIIVEDYINPSQAALFRLNGDKNPLHIDPEFSSLAGYKIPILHGLCSFGIVAQHAINIFGNGFVENFKKIKTRFSKPVIPGQTLITEFWKDENTVYFQCKVKETGEVCLSGGYIEFSGNIKAKL